MEFRSRQEGLFACKALGREVDRTIGNLVRGFGVFRAKCVAEKVLEMMLRLFRLAQGRQKERQLLTSGSTSTMARAKARRRARKLRSALGFMNT